MNRFAKLLIKNFRSVDSNGITIEFRNDENVLVLVGPNGSGKSNALHALAIVLGVYPFNRFEAHEDDFHCKNTGTELVIELWFSDPLIDRDIYQKEYQIHGFRYRRWRALRGDGKGVLKTEHYCFDANGRTITKPQRIYKKPTAGDEIDNAALPVLVSDQAWKVADTFYLDAPSLERFFERTTGWSPLARLFDLYRSDFDAEFNKYEIEKGKSITSRQAFDRLAAKLADVLRTEKLTEIETSLAATVAKYFGSDAADALRLQFSLPTSREIFDDWMSLYFSDCAGVPALPAARLGSGARALLRLAVIECMLRMTGRERPLLLLLEEPEVYLHVHARRHFNRVLHELGSGDHGVVLTTHSPEFVIIDKPREIVRVRKLQGGKTNIRQVKTGSTFDFGKIAQKIRRLGNEELFFASHVMFVEGRDDREILLTLVEKRGVDPDRHAISIIACDSVTSIQDYVKLCSELAIDFYVVHDTDDPVREGTRNAKIESAVAATNPSAPALHRFPVRLEEAMGESGKPGVDILLAKIVEKDYAVLAAEMPDLIKPVEEFVSSRDLATGVSHAG